MLFTREGQFLTEVVSVLASFGAYNEDPAFLVDTATKQGMSGLPVYMYIRRGYTSCHEGIILAVKNKRHFLGIYSGRLGNDSMEAQLGIVWTKDAVDFPLVT